MGSTTSAFHSNVAATVTWARPDSRARDAMASAAVAARTDNTKKSTNPTGPGRL